MREMDKRSFDLDKLSRKMPYSVSDDLFERLPEQTLARIMELDREAEMTQSAESSRWTLGRRVSRYVAMALTSAAAIIVALVVMFDTSRRESSEAQSEQAIDGFVAKLTDEELNLLVSEVDMSYEFYTNL